MRLIDADRLKADLMRDYNAYRKRGAEVTLYDISYTLGEILERFVDDAPTIQFVIGRNVVELEEDE